MTDCELCCTMKETLWFWLILAKCFSLESQPAQIKNSLIQRGISRVKQPREKAREAAPIIQRNYKRRVVSKPASDYLRSKHLCVRHNINNTSPRFKTFVANGLEIIHSSIDVNDWDFIPTASNPADLALRDVWPNKCQSVYIWFHGQMFLRYIAVE